MPLTLYCNLTSPYARRVRLALRLLEMEATIAETVVDPFSRPDELLAKHPLSKIPVLCDDAGLVLPDSRLILGYLYQQHGRALPDACGDWEAARQLVVIEGVIDAGVGIVLENRRPESIRHPAQIDRLAETIERSLESLPGAWTTEQLAAADPLAVSLATALAYLDFRMPWLRWRPRHTELATWLDACAAHPAMQQTQPPDSA